MRAQCSPPKPRRLKYEPLRAHLAEIAGPEWQGTFADVERIIGARLPPSARNANSAVWWSNSNGHVQAEAWLAAGWRKHRVEVDRERVVFRRTEPEPNPATPFEQGKCGAPFQPSRDQERTSYREAYLAGALTRIASALEGIAEAIKVR